MEIISSVYSPDDAESTPSSYPEATSIGHLSQLIDLIKEDVVRTQPTSEIERILAEMMGERPHAYIHFSEVHLSLKHECAQSRELPIVILSDPTGILEVKFPGSRHEAEAMVRSSTSDVVIDNIFWREGDQMRGHMYLDEARTSAILTP